MRGGRSGATDVNYKESKSFVHREAWKKNVRHNSLFCNAFSDTHILWDARSRAAGLASLCVVWWHTFSSVHRSIPYWDAVTVADFTLPAPFGHRSQSSFFRRWSLVWFPLPFYSHL